MCGVSRVSKGFIQGRWKAHGGGKHRHYYTRCARRAGIVVAVLASAMFTHLALSDTFATLGNGKSIVVAVLASAMLPHLAR